MLSAVFYFPIIVNYRNFGHNGITAISNSAIQHKKLTFFQLFTYLSPEFFFPYTITVLLS